MALPSPLPQRGQAALVSPHRELEDHVQGRNRQHIPAPRGPPGEIRVLFPRSHPGQPQDGAETHTASSTTPVRMLSAGPNTFKIKVRCIIEAALPAFWAAGEQRAAELLAALRDGAEPSGQGCGRRVGSPPAAAAPQTPRPVASQTLTPPRSGQNLLGQVRGAAESRFYFTSIRMSAGQEGEVSAELALPALTSQHPSSKRRKGCQKTWKQNTALTGTP